MSGSIGHALFFVVRALESDVVLELGFVGDVGGGIDSREGAEIMNEVRLVEVAAGQGDFGPVNCGGCRGAACDFAKDLLKPLDAAEEFGSHADLTGKQLNEAAIAEADLIGDG